MTRGSAGLICAGGVTQSFLARWPSVLAAIGPVKSVSLRVARRLANSLHAGYAVEHTSAFDNCELVGVAVPDALLDRRLGDAASHCRAVVVCDSTRGSESLARGECAVATLNAADPGERVFVAEGHVNALALLRRAASRENRKLIELRPCSKAMFVAAGYLAGHLMLPAFAAAVESLRAAGFPRSEATRVAEMISARAVRTYTKAGRKAWRPGAAPELRRSMEQDGDAIRGLDREIADMYESAIEQAVRYFGPR